MKPLIEQKRRRRIAKGLQSQVRKNWDLYLLILPVVVFFFIFHYMPMYGVQIAFKNFNPALGIWDSPVSGFNHFERFFNSFYFERLLKNTLSISVMQLVLGFPMPILLALMLNEVIHKRYKSLLQMVTYAPHFLSTVVMASMLISFLNPNYGIINQLLQALGFDPVFFMAQGKWFKGIYVISEIWQNTGWGSIIYVSAIASVDQQLYEAARVDGAGKFRQILNITIPAILPTAIIMLILNTGQIMNVGFEKVFLLQNDMNLEASDIISTYVYRSGILKAEYSFSSAVGLFNSVINFILLVLVNQIARKKSETSLW